jgi:23S rRNA (uracil1939-C5)-methyltransferase
LARRHRKNKPKQYQLTIESLSNEGRGIAHFEGKTIFVRGALIGEKVIAQRYLNRSKYDEADTVEVLTKASQRIEAKCEVFGICGGCSLQYLSSEDQVLEKQKWLKDHMQQQAKIAPKTWLEPILSNPWQYRRKARLGVRYVEKKGTVLVGFREKKSSFITVMDRCEVLHPAVGEKITELKECLSQLSIKQFIPQIEVAITDEITVLILRHLEPLTQEDKDILFNFGVAHNICWYLQSKGPDSVVALHDEVQLNYQIPKHNISLDFKADDFTQVNFEVNEKMIDRALELLELQPNESILDLFCGLGNFSCVLGKYAQSVVAVDFDKALIQRARDNAIANKLDNITFYTADLSKEPTGQPWFQGKTYDKILIDPARSGAAEIIEFLPKLKASTILYVSCNPATLARDTALLLDQGFKLTKAGIMDMFPHTAHVESMALFKK